MTSSAHRLVRSWSSGLGGGPGGLASDDDGAVVSVDNDSVAALSVKGVQLWSTPVPGAGLGWLSLGDGIVVVPTLRDGGGPGGCVALDRATGAPRWSYEEPASEGVAVARAGRNVLCALGNGVIVAIDRVTGHRRWRTALGDQTPGVPTPIAERTALAVNEATGRVAVTVSAGLIASVALLALDTGANRGAFNLSKFGPLSAPAWTAPGVLAIAVSNPPSVCELDLRTFDFGTCVGVPAELGFDPATVPLLAGGLVVVAARGGEVSAVDLATKSLRWARQTPNPIVGTRLVEVAGIVMFSDWTRVPWAVHLADGEPLGLPAAEGWVISTVADPAGGFEVAKRNMDGGWIERWVPA